MDPGLKEFEMRQADVIMPANNFIISQRDELKKIELESGVRNQLYSSYLRSLPHSTTGR